MRSRPLARQTYRNTLTLAAGSVVRSALHDTDLLRDFARILTNCCMACDLGSWGVPGVRGADSDATERGILGSS